MVDASESVAPRNHESDNHAAKSWKKQGFFVLALFIAIACAYSNSLSGQFVFDDYHLIAGRDCVKNFVPIEMLKSDRPILLFTLAINHAFEKMDSPTYYHLVNIAIHVAAAFVLFLLTKSILGIAKFCPVSHINWIALGIAAIWSVHPLQTQSVTYIVQRGESLCGLFYLLCLYLTLKASTAPTRSIALQVTIVLCCLLGMFTKGVMITIPVALVLIDKLVAQTTWRDILMKRGFMYLAVGGISINYAVYAMTVEESLASGGIGFLEENPSPFEYLCTQAVVIVHYLKLAFWPQTLCIDYNWPIEKDMGRIAFNGLIVLSLLATTIFCMFRKPITGFVLAAFFVVLAPTSSFLPICDAAFEHRMYLPLASVAAIFVLGVYQLAGVFSKNANLSKKLFLSATAIPLVCLIARTQLRNVDYIHPVNLYQQAADVAPRNSRAQFNLGYRLLKLNRWDEAIVAFDRAIKLNPKDHVAICHRSSIRQQQGHLDEARSGYQRVIELVPTYSQAHCNLARLLESESQLSLAEASYLQAIKHSPKNPRYLESCGNFFARQERFNEAIAKYRHTIELDPLYRNVYVNLSLALRKSGRYSEALELLQTATRRFPDDVRFAKQIVVVRSELQSTRS